ncbi:MAG: hypothetical protein AAGJ37_08390 [Pseudomonadota bacterium]
MLAKNVFFTVVVIGASYLAYQYYQPQNHPQSTVSAQKSSARDTETTTDLIEQVNTLQKQVEILERHVALLERSQPVNPQELEPNDKLAANHNNNLKPLVESPEGVTRNKSVETFHDKIDMQVSSSKTPLSNNLIDASFNSLVEQVSDSKTETVVEKRLLQQSQLRAIAEKHEVAALNVLVH